MPRMTHPKSNGYAHPRSNPESRINDRRRRAADVLTNCKANHPRTADGHCAQPAPTPNPS